MEKNIIELAAHGSSGVSELKTRRAGLLTSAKNNDVDISREGVCNKGRAFLFVLLATSFISFPLLSGQYNLLSMSVHYFKSPTATETLAQSFTSSFISSDDAASFYRSVDDALYSFLYTKTNALALTKSPPGVTAPNIYAGRTTSRNMNNPVGVSTNGSITTASFFVPYSNLPRSYSLFTTAAAYFSINPGSRCFDIKREYGNGNSYNVNFCPAAVFAEISMSTNSLVVSSFLAEFARINSSLSGISELVDVNAYTLSDILDNLSGYVGPLRSKPFTEQIEAYAKFGDSYLGGLLPAQLQDIKDTYNSLADTDPLAAARYADSVLSGLQQSSNLTGFKKALEQVGPTASDALEALGELYNKQLQRAVDSGFSASAHIQGATTNLLQKMTNITDQIKKDLQDWRTDTTNSLAQWRTDATNRLDRQWDGIKTIRDNTTDTAANVSTIVNDGVKVNGPVQVTIGTDNLNVDIANTDLESLVDGFADGSDAAIQRWLDEWEIFKDDQLPYMARFSAFVCDNTNLLSSIEKRLDFGFTNTLGATYAFLTNGLERAISNGVAGIGLNLTNELWDYYFDRFQKANEFKDDEGQLFSSIDNQRQLVFGNGFDDAEYIKLDWFSRVELLLYQIGYASTNSTESIEASDLEGEFDDVSDEIQTAASAFEGAASRVVGVFSLVGGFAQAIRNAFSDVAAPSTDGILLLEGGSWIFEEPLVLRIPVLIQNALRLVFQCIWYLSAFVIGWRLVSFAWGRVASLVRWLWSLIDV